MDRKSFHERRVSREFSRLAKEEIPVEILSGAAYGQGSELACLRLFHKYNSMQRNKRTEIFYSDRYDSWVSRLEIPFIEELLGHEEAQP